MKINNDEGLPIRNMWGGRQADKLTKNNIKQVIHQAQLAKIQYQWTDEQYEQVIGSLKKGEYVDFSTITASNQAQEVQVQNSSTGSQDES